MSLNPSDDDRMNFSLVSSVMGPQPEMEFNNRISIDTEQIVGEEGNPIEETKAEMLLGIKSFKSKLHHEPEATFVVEKGSDGKIIPLPARPAVDNQKLYLEKYCTNVSLPSLYVIDA